MIKLVTTYGEFAFAAVCTLWLIQGLLDSWGVFKAWRQRR